ncbi:MAPEG family protein [Dyella sp.]|uniref:MAPEG family protein n=1 Tax=Dyella sp. TaxID=1869338 RepID=UPI002D76E4A9|nr:MAPEG family protein [Dyella sp.]HET7333107.1 MAPEG family protein [Dyella sp.]HET7371025.1 MAPEG family protein [Gammaproteobacteria bacterium]
MSLTKAQSGILSGMAAGAGCALAIVILGAWLNPFLFLPDLSIAARLSTAVQAALVPAIFLVVSVGRLAKHRFFTPEDIDGAGLSIGTDRAKLLQALLQNTLEQFCIAVIAYLAWAVVMPSVWLSVALLAAFAFGLGRILFFIGYRRGGPSRALGFTLTFYPSAIMLAVAAGAELWRLAG